MTVAELLRDAREQRALTLEQLADETRIPVDRLAAFERDGLPRNGGFYERAQIRAYGQALGIDRRSVLEALEHDLASAALALLGQSVRQKPEQVIAPPKPAGQFRVSWSTVVIGGIVATAFVAGAQMRTSRAARTSVAVPGQLNSGPTSLATSGLADSPTAVAASPAEPAATELVVFSQPQGARVTVDGIGWGATPVTIRYLSPGLKRIRVSRDGHASAERVVQVDEDRSNRIFFRLRTSSSLTRVAR